METTLLYSLNQLFGTFREEQRGGRDYLVVNGVPLVEGVLNGRFVSADEFGKFTQDWNDIPIVLRHPKQNDGSARVVSPDVPVIGRFYNAKMDGKRLVGEYWFDKQVLDGLGMDGETIVQLIENNHPLETSTGYWSESIPEAGKFNGKEFGLVDQNIHPDHIALLTDEVGACSLKDGCGINRNSAMCQNCKFKKTKQNAVTPDGSYEMKAESIREAFYGQFRTSRESNAVAVSDYWLERTYPDYVICHVDGEMYRVGYSTQNGEVVFDDRSNWLPVMKIENYVVIKQNVTGSLPAEGKKIYEAVYQEYKDKNMSDEEAAKRAWGAVKKTWYQDKDGVWHKKESKQNQESADDEIILALFLADAISKGE